MNSLLKYSWIPSLMVIVGLTVISSCKDDEKPKTGVSFDVAEQDVNESDGTIEVKIKFEKALSDKVVLAYTLGGTALVEATSDDNKDYNINPVGGYITIDKGSTEKIVELDLLEDLNPEFEADDEGNITSTVETIILTLTEVVQGPAVLKEQSVFTLNVYEDDLFVQASWETDPQDVDMDIFLWIDNPEDDPDEGFYTINPDYVGGIGGSNQVEYALILGALPEADYGFSFVYYEGTSDDLTFTVQYINFGGTINGGSSVIEKTGHYTSANINEWDNETTGEEPQKVQDLEKVGLNFINLSNITTPTAGSRMNVISKPLDLSKFKKGESMKLSPKTLAKLNKVFKSR